jgi:hypothetical protein
MKIFVLTPAGGVCCVWFIYPVWCWLWCPEIEITSVDWAQLSKLYAWGRRQYPVSETLVLIKKPGRWIKAKKPIIVSMCHPHKLLDRTCEDSHYAHYFPALYYSIPLGSKYSPQHPVLKPTPITFFPYYQRPSFIDENVQNLFCIIITDCLDIIHRPNFYLKHDDE